jgi:hypothetical protein
MAHSQTNVDFLDLVLYEGFKLLTAKKVKWPHQLTKEQKIELIEACIHYYTEREDYEKCASLTQSKIIVEISKPKGRPRKISN